MMKLTAKQVETWNKLRIEAEKASLRFGRNEISLLELKFILIGIAYKISSIAGNDGDFEYWVEMIDEQIDLYEYDKKYKYLLSLTSSGSLLRQFEVYDEYELVES